MTGRHGGCRPKRQQKAQIKRMPYEFVKKGRFEDRGGKLPVKEAREDL
jgi:hypothetical protein